MALGKISGLRQLTTYIDPVDEDLAHVARLRHLKSIDFQTSPKLTDDALRCLGRLPQLERLTISGGQYTAAGFKHLAGLRHLKKLGLVSWQRSAPSTPLTDPLVTWLGSERAIEVTDQDMAEIGQLTELEELRLASILVTDVGLAHLSALANLKTLELGATNITTAGFEHLAKLQNLQQVKLYCPRLSDDGLRFVAEWRQLQYLELYRTTIDGSGFQHFAADSKIKSVFIFEGPNVSDNVIPPLAHLTNLSQLQLHGTRVTVENLGQLQAAPKLASLWITPTIEGDLTGLSLLLPKCRILRLGKQDLTRRRGK
jgi:Leucine-rich repeat (LRR) protein